MTYPTLVLAGDEAAARRAARILLFCVVMPFAFTAAFAVWRIGDRARHAYATALIAVADSAAGRIAARRTAPDFGAGTDSTIRFDLRQAGYTAALFLAADRWQNADPAAPADESMRAQLSTEMVARLESLDRSFAATLDGRITAIAPVRDADQWDIIAAFAVRANAPDPARLPLRPLVVASIALAFLILAARYLHGLMLAPSAAPPPAGSHRMRHGSPAGQDIPLTIATSPAAAGSARMGSPTSGIWRSPRQVRLAMLVVGAAPILFAAWLAASPAAGSHGFLAVVLLGVWAVPALIGLGLAPLAQRPLVLREATHAWAFLAPSLVHLLVFSIGPILFALWLSFHEWNLLDPVRPFVGLDNYRELAADGAFWRAVVNTAVYVLFVPAGMVVEIGRASCRERV